MANLQSWLHFRVIQATQIPLIASFIDRSVDCILLQIGLMSFGNRQHQYLIMPSSLRYFLGTFRKADCGTKSVVPLLPGIYFYLDSNNSKDASSVPSISLNPTTAPLQ